MKYVLTDALGSVTAGYDAVVAWLEVGGWRVLAKLRRLGIDPTAYRNSCG